MAQAILNNGESGAVIRGKINDNFTELYSNTLQLGNSLVYSGEMDYKVPPILTEGVGQADLELINIGNWLSSAQGLESRNLNPGGLMRAVGSVLLYRNFTFNDSLNRFEQFNTAADSFGSSRIEMGGEGVNLVHDPPGVHPYQTPAGTMAFSVRGDGPRGLETQSAVTGYVNQSMAKVFLSYHSTDNYAQLGYWMNGASDPMLWLHTKEAKGTDNEMFRLEANASSATVYGGQYFHKSRGTMTSKTAVVADDIGGVLGWKFYDGNSYELTSVIQSVAKGTIGDGNAGSSLQFRTSATNTAGLATQIEIMDGSQIGFFGVTPVARQVVPTGSTTDQVITALQNLGLFSQS